MKRSRTSADEVLAASLQIARDDLALACAIVVVEGADDELAGGLVLAGLDLGAGGCVVDEPVLAGVGSEAVLGVDLAADLEPVLCGRDVREQWRRRIPEFACDCGLSRGDQLLFGGRAACQDQCEGGDGRCHQKDTYKSAH